MPEESGQLQPPAETLRPPADGPSGEAPFSAPTGLDARPHQHAGAAELFGLRQSWSPVARFLADLRTKCVAARERYKDSLLGTLGLTGAVAGKLGCDAYSLLTHQGVNVGQQVVPVLALAVVASRLSRVLYRRWQPAFEREKTRAIAQLEGGVLRLALEPEAWLLVPALRGGTPHHPGAEQNLAGRLQRLLENYDRCCQQVGLESANWKTQLRHWFWVVGPSIIYLVCGFANPANGSIWTGLFLSWAIQSWLEDYRKLRDIGRKEALWEVLRPAPAEASVAFVPRETNG